MWFAAVAMVSAALGALILQVEVGKPLHGLMQTLFVVLVVIAGASFGVTLLTGVRALWATGRNRKPAAKVETKPGVSYEGITLELVDDSKWDLWRGWR